MTTPDVDDVAVDRAVNGDLTVTLNHDEAVAAFDWLVAHGYGPTNIGERLGCAERTVNRWVAGDSVPTARCDGKWLYGYLPPWARSA